MQGRPGWVGRLGNWLYYGISKVGLSKSQHLYHGARNHKKRHTGAGLCSLLYQRISFCLMVFMQWQCSDRLAGDLMPVTVSRSCIVSKRLKLLYGMRIGPTRAFECYHFRWPWVTPKLHFKVSATVTVVQRQLSFLFWHIKQTAVVYSICFLLFNNPQHSKQLSSTDCKAVNMVQIHCATEWHANWRINMMQQKQNTTILQLPKRILP